jgi:hypothetical protein
VRRCVLIVVTAAALGIVVSAAAIAGAKPASTTASAPALTGTTVAHVGETYTVTGSGFQPGSIVPLELAEANGCCIALNMVADASGNFSYTGEVYAAGAYGVRAMAQRNGGRWRVVATWSFTAY